MRYPIGELAAPERVLVGDREQSGAPPPPADVLRDADGSTGPAVIRPDSKYAMDLATGMSVPHENVALARRLRRRFLGDSTRQRDEVQRLVAAGLRPALTARC